MVIDLDGNWHRGKAYDVHTVSSTYLGVDELGHDKFETARSKMGELVYQLKYRSDKSVLPEIVELLDEIKGIEKFDYLVPVPATKKSRPFQPVELIAQALGERRGVKVLSHCLENSGDLELKGISDPVERSDRLKSAIKIADGVDVSGKSVLLVDDLYRSGSTLMVATDILYKTGKARNVCVLTMTKTRSHR